MFLSFKMGFSLASAAIVWAALESMYILEPSSQIMAPRCLKWSTVSNFCPCMVMSLCKVPLFVITLVLSAFISMPNFLAAVSNFCRVLLVCLPLLWYHQCHRQTEVCDLTTPNADGAVIVLYCCQCWMSNPLPGVIWLWLVLDGLGVPPESDCPIYPLSNPEFLWDLWMKKQASVLENINISIKTTLK